MTLSKEKFCEILGYLRESNKFEEDLRRLLGNSERATDFMDAAMFTDCRLTDYLVYLLEFEFEDLKTGWISYWIYDLNFGRRWDSCNFIDGQGRPIQLKTEEDLYDFLIENVLK